MVFRECVCPTNTPPRIVEVPSETGVQEMVPPHKLISDSDEDHNSDVRQNQDTQGINVTIVPSPPM